MRFSTITLGLATAAHGAVIQARDSGCTVTVSPLDKNLSGVGETLAFGSLDRWFSATHQPVDSTFIDVSTSLAPPYTIKYLANTKPGYETDAEIEAVISNGWVGTYLFGVAKPVDHDWLITGYSCN